jgi:hypothetical protein
LKNYATDAETVSVRAFLGPNVRFTGQSKTSVAGGTAPVYNERTQEVTWEIGKIPANRGILSPAYEAVFQIELTPSLDQAQTSPILIRESKLTYLDAFTGESLTGTDTDITTQLPDDRTVADEQKRVMQ